MNILALDASNKYFSVAVENNGKILAETVSETVDSHNEKLSAAIDQTLSTAKIDIKNLSLVVVGEGPGSFTGLRIGYGIAMGISFSLKIPLFAYSSFAAAAMLYWERYPALLVCSDARREELFYTLFQGDIDVQARIAPKKEVESLATTHKAHVVRIDAEALSLASGLCLLRERLGARIAEEPDYVRAVSARTIKERKELTSA